MSEREKKFAAVELPDNSFTIIFTGLGAGEVEALRVSLHDFAKSERARFNNGNTNGPHISAVGANAESLYNLMTGA